uniref:Uncharacterized protein n=1 Tax=Rhodococcus hoagii TaxID=43767 RepID=A0A1Z1UXK6_RHOHA|nr:hypothetical protein pVAPN1572_0911 [Prescottella equi]
MNADAGRSPVLGHRQPTAPPHHPQRDVVWFRLLRTLIDELCAPIHHAGPSDPAGVGPTLRAPLAPDLPALRSAALARTARTSRRRRRHHRPPGGGRHHPDGGATGTCSSPNTSAMTSHPDRPAGISMLGHGAPPSTAINAELPASGWTSCSPTRSTKPVAIHRPRAPCSLSCGTDAAPNGSPNGCWPSLTNSTSPPAVFAPIYHPTRMPDRRLRPSQHRPGRDTQGRRGPAPLSSRARIREAIPVTRCSVWVGGDKCSYRT